MSCNNCSCNPCCCQPTNNCPPGERGPRGYKGEPGTNGTDGADGAGGVGPQGIPGTNGTDGIDGVNGDNGDNGDYVVQSVESPGINCPNGGTRVHVISGTTGLVLSETFVCNGEDGADGQDGLNGAPGADGVDGQDGVDGVVPDTGWFDLEGFNHYSGVAKPQCRKIGKQIHFRGDIVVPISDGVGGVVGMTPTSYPETYRSNLFQGVGGVTLDAESRLQFNSNSGVIPITVMGVPDQLDGDYRAPRIVATRELQVADLLAGDGGTSTTLLSAVVEVEILADKTLRLTALDTLETNPSDSPAADFKGASLFRHLTTSFEGRTNVLDFRQFDSWSQQTGRQSVSGVTVFDGGQPLNAGWLYTIREYQPGDDFTNVGATINITGESFIATGPTPTVWANGSIVEITAFRGVTLVRYYNTAIPPAPLRWPTISDGSLDPLEPAWLGIEAGDPLQLGGFSFTLDGLMAFIN